MKPLSYAFLAAAAACGLASAAETAYTTPVGYITLDVPANSDTTIVAPLDRPVAYAGASTSISSNDVGAADLTAGAFVSPASYLQVTSGVLAGNRYPITANTTSTITVDPVSGGTLQAQGFLSGDKFKVVPYWTLATMFPGGAGVGGTSDVFDVSSFLFVNDNGTYGVNRASSASYFYCTGDVGNGVPAGWYDANDPFGASMDNLVLDPTTFFFIRNGGTAKTVTVTGDVPNVASGARVPVNTSSNDVNLGISFPVDTTLQASGLQSVVQGTNDVFTIDEFVFVYANEAAGVNKAPSAGYFYCTGDAGNGIPAGWYDANDPFGGEVTGAVLKAGRCITVRKAAYGSSGVLNLSVPLPYSL